MHAVLLGTAAVLPQSTPSHSAAANALGRGAPGAHTKTRAIFYTESDYEPTLRSWVGRVSVLRSATPESP